MIDRIQRMAKGRKRQLGGAVAGLLASVRNRRPPDTYAPGVTVMTVNWNSLNFLRVMLDATRAMSPSATRFLVVDNGSSDGSRDFLRQQPDVEAINLPINVGHGAALDIGLTYVTTEFVAILDIDAFPVSPQWLDTSLAALAHGAQIAGALQHRNYIHPCFFVTRTGLIRESRLSFRVVRSPWHRFQRDPLYLDVGEALCQRVVLHHGGSSVLHKFPITSVRGPGTAGATFGGLVYHNLGATWGNRQAVAMKDWRDAVSVHHPRLS